MNKDNCSPELEEILNQYIADSYTKNEKLNNNLFKIQELECYIDSLCNSEDNDIKVFSPRGVEKLHKDDIEKARNDIFHLNEMNSLLMKDIENNNKFIESLQDSIAKLNVNNSITDNTVDQDHNSSVKNVLDDSSNFDLNMIRLIENDRQRIASGLHDTSLQNLSHIIHKLELSGMFIDQDPMRAKMEIDGVIKEVRNVISDIRDCIFDLRAYSLDNFALFSSINQLFKTINSDNRYIIETDINNVSRENSLFEITVYRILQECILNIHHHASATKIYFKYEEHDQYIHIVVSDNGCGFDIDSVEDKHFGILLMKERVRLLGGTIKYFSSVDSGTKIDISIPIPSDDTV